MSIQNYMIKNLAMAIENQTNNKKLGINPSRS